MLLNAYCTHRSPPALSFPHQLKGRRDRNDPELFEHLRGFMSFVMGGGKRPMNATRYAVIQHLQRVQHHVSVEVDDAHMAGFITWATSANAIVFVPDGTVRAPGGAILVEPQNGDAQQGAAVPYPADALQRKTAHERRLEALGVRVLGSLPPVVSEIEVELREPSEVAARCLALLACAVRAESLTSGDELPTAELKMKIPGGYEAMSPKERAFFDASSPSQQDVVNHAWRYEALAVLAWATTLVPELPLPNRTCDVPMLAKTMFAAPKESFVREARLRSEKEILDALDLHFRCHWATTDARINDRPMPGGLDPGVVAERHHALNWLTRSEDEDWDDVTTPT
jgi:hypothetical protein